MEGYPTNPTENPEAGQAAQQTGWENMAQNPAPQVEAAPAGGEAVAPAPEVAAPAPEIASQVPVNNPAEIGAAALSAAAEQPAAPVASVAAEAVGTSETDKGSDDLGMVNFILGRLYGDLDTLKNQGETPETADKREKIGDSIRIFDRVGFELGDAKSQGKALESVPDILQKIGRESSYLADKTQDEAEKAGYTKQAALADEWASSYEQRKAKRAEEEAKGTIVVTEATETIVEAPANSATPEPGSANAALNDVAAAMAAALAEATPGAAPAPAAQMAGAANEAPVGAGTEINSAVTPANAGETTQPNAVPLPTDGVA